MLTTLLVFSATALFFAMIPGPDFILILRVSLIHGRRASIFASLGIGCGLLVHSALSVAGLSAVIAHSPLLFRGITYAGAAYLAWLGLHSLLARSSPEKPAAKDGARAGSRNQGGPWGSFVQGFLTNVLNPKAIIFFLTLLPQFVDHAFSVPVPMQLTALGAAMCLVSAAWFVCLSLALARLRRFAESPVFRRRMDRVAGTIFLGFSVKLLATS